MLKWCLGLLVVYLLLKFTVRGRQLSLHTQYHLIDTWYLALPEYKKPSSSVALSNYLCISLSTSPKRLREDISRVFDTISSSVPIILNIPKLYRHKDPYDMQHLATLVHKVPNMYINFIDRDLGPQTKLLGVLQNNFLLYVINTHYGQAKNALDASIAVIVIDDDTVYSNKIVRTYDECLLKVQPRTVLSRNNKNPLGLKYVMGCNSFCVRPVDLPQDFTQRVMHYASLSKTCKHHDDLLFSTVFQDLSFHFVAAKDIIHDAFGTQVQLLSGYGDDSLHNEVENVTKTVICLRDIWNSKESCPNAGLINFIISNYFLKLIF